MILLGNRFLWVIGNMVIEIIVFLVEYYESMNISLFFKYLLVVFSRIFLTKRQDVSLEWFIELKKRVLGGIFALLIGHEELCAHSWKYYNASIKLGWYDGKKVAISGCMYLENMRISDNSGIEIWLKYSRHYSKAYVLSL